MTNRDDKVDSFEAMFRDPPTARRADREVRAKKERRTQLTDKQRARAAVRTTQLCFRCSPEFKARVALAQSRLQRRSVADVLEDAMDALEKTING